MPIFVCENSMMMETSLLEMIRTRGICVGHTCSCVVDDSFSVYGPMQIRKGFFFLLVTNGTACLDDVYRHYEIGTGNLVVLTPSTESVLGQLSSGFRMQVLYVVPDYFDSLPDGQALYNQVARLLGNFRLPVFVLEQSRMEYLSQTLSLFSRQLEDLSLYRDGIIRHLCSFVLLQMADALCRENLESSVYVKRSSEIFRQFKKLLVQHYRQHHDIGFYAGCLNISTTYLSRIVKNITGHTVRFHLSELLGADARRMLECTDLDVQEISNQLGFSDQSVFGKFFIRQTGLSPLKFRMRKEELRKQ